MADGVAPRRSEAHGCGHDSTSAEVHGFLNPSRGVPSWYSGCKGAQHVEAAWFLCSGETTWIRFDRSHRDLRHTQSVVVSVAGDEVGGTSRPRRSRVIPAHYVAYEQRRRTNG
jgi:hypothetical protein